MRSASSAFAAAAFLFRLLLLRLLQAVFLTGHAARQCARRVRWTLSRPLPDRVPTHVGVVVGGTKSIDVRDVGRVVRSCASAGVGFVTLCDAHGELARAAADLRSELSDVATVVLAAEDLAACDPVAVAHGTVTRETRHRLRVRIITIGDGRDDLVHAAQRVCERVLSGQLPSEAVNEAVVEGELRTNQGFPEPVRLRPHHHGSRLAYWHPPRTNRACQLTCRSFPHQPQTCSLQHDPVMPVHRTPHHRCPRQDLILQCCPELYLGGLLPWHCRVTQYAHIGSIRRASDSRVRAALHEYAAVQQRYGR